MQRTIHPTMLRIVPQSGCCCVRLKKIFKNKLVMETLSQVIEKKNTFQIMWDRLNPRPEFRDRFNAACRYWNTLTIERQRQIYYDIDCRLNRGEEIAPNPLFAIQDATPAPFNWNGQQGIKDMMKKEKMVSARYYDKYGIYTLKEAKIFEMEDIKPLNFHDESQI